MASAGKCPDLQRIRQRIRLQEGDYYSHNFSEAQRFLLRTFFDLAQEFESLQDFYRLCVAAPQECMGLESALYLVDEKSDSLQLVCSCREGIPATPTAAPESVQPVPEAYQDRDRYVVPVPTVQAAVAQFGAAVGEADLPVMGVLVVAPAAGLSAADRVFLNLYANRIGIHLHNRLLALQNIQHLKFINTLVVDIEHNFIVPNMYFRHLFNNLRRSIAELESVAGAMTALAGAKETDPLCAELLARISRLHHDLVEQHHELQEHHATTSLFMESLFRRDHFVQGHLVLRPRFCRVEEEIIAPQLAHFANRFQTRGITVETPVDMAGEGMLLVVDVGLLSQVYANFFSNALKYVEEINDHRGRLRKALAYGREIVADQFGPGQPGVKFNVFTTGPHLTPQEAAAVFTEGYRGEKYKGLPGSGHGLAFVKQVVEIHGGVVGYEPTAEGNNFYFILPLPDTESPLAEIIACPPENKP